MPQIQPGLDVRDGGFVRAGLRLAPLLEHPHIKQKRARHPGTGSSYGKPQCGHWNYELMTHRDVRRAVPADATAAREVIERAIRISTASCYPAEAVDAWARGGSVKGVQRMIEETHGFVAVLDGAVVGWANLDGKEVDQLYVDPIAGGSGVARLLYEAVEQLARAEGLAVLTAVASLRAAPAFRRFGFHDVVEDERSFNGHTFVVLHMAKRLSARCVDRRSAYGSP